MTMAMPKLFTTYERIDGTVVGPLRVYAADRIAAENTAHKRGWEWRDNPTNHSLMTFYAAKRTGSTDAADYSTFVEELVDFQLTSEEPDEDPTQEAPSAS